MTRRPISEAAVSGRTPAVLDALARKLWRAHAEGQVDDAHAEACSVAIEARRAALGSAGRCPTPENTSRRPSWGFLEAPDAGRRCSASVVRAPSTATPRSGSCTGRAAWGHDKIGATAYANLDKKGTQ